MMVAMTVAMVGCMVLAVMTMAMPAGIPVLLNVDDEENAPWLQPLGESLRC